MRLPLVIAAICSAATPAAAAQPFEIFKQLCIETEGKPAAAMERARARGWSPPVEDATQNAREVQGARVFQGLILYGHQRESSYALLIHPASPDAPATCEVAVPDGDASSMSGDVERWAGFKPVRRGLNDYWLYSMRAGAPVSENPLYEGSWEKLKAAQATRRLFLVETVAGHTPTYWLRPLPSAKQGH